MKSANSPVHVKWNYSLYQIKWNKLIYSCVNLGGRRRISPTSCGSASCCTSCRCCCPGIISRLLGLLLAAELLLFFFFRGDFLLRLFLIIIPPRCCCEGGSSWFTEDTEASDAPESAEPFRYRQGLMFIVSYWTRSWRTTLHCRWTSSCRSSTPHAPRPVGGLVAPTLGIWYCWQRLRRHCQTQLKWKRQQIPGRRWRWSGRTDWCCATPVLFVSVTPCPLLVRHATLITHPDTDV